MNTKRFLMMTAAMIAFVTPAIAQNQTEIQQQKTEAAVAGQAAKTNAAAAPQAQKTQAATADQAAKTQAASQDQAQRTQAATQKQAEETAAAVRRQQGYGQTPVYVYPPVSTGEAVLYGVGSAAASTAATTATTAPPLYNTGNVPAGGAGAEANSGEKQLQDLFNEIDTNHDGFVSKTEYSIYYKTTAEDPRFDSYDINRDMMLSYYEFHGPNASGGNVTIPKN